MEANETPSRIDKIFADGRLIDEALVAARADAVERHRRAGVPLVVVRDGRIEHVPADRLAPDADAVLTDADFKAKRRAKDWIEWYDERRAMIKDCLLARESATLHKGRFKQFYEELYPFVLWLSHVYAGREDVTGALNSDRTRYRDYDAVIKDGSTVTYVEITTTTFNRSELLNRKKLLTEGAVVDPIARTQEEWRERLFKKIEAAVQNKSKQSFGRDYVLIVSFDDFAWFGTDDDKAALTSFVSAHLPSWNLKAARLYIIGESGRTFESFPVPRP
jgi:hypothetical protein